MKQCIICRKPICTDGQVNIPINVNLQKIIEKKYPNKVKQKEIEEKKRIENKERGYFLIPGLPIILSDQHIYPGMKTVIKINTPHLIDLVVILSNSAALR